CPPPTVFITASRTATPFGTIRLAAGIATKDCASIICCCRHMRRTGSLLATSTRSREPRSGPRITRRSGASWQLSLSAKQETLRSGGERVRSFSERRKRHDDQGAIAWHEICEVVSDRKVALARHGEQERVSRRNRPARLAYDDFAHGKLLTGKCYAPTRTREPR